MYLLVLTKHRTMNIYGAVEEKLHSFTLILDGGSGQLHTLAALSLEKGPNYPLDRRLGGPQNQFGHRAKKNPGHPAVFCN